MECLSGKVILITGASTGIGGNTARYLSKYKPKLVLVARSPDKLKTVQELCEKGGAGKGNVVTVVADLAKQEELARVISEAVKAFGQLDALVNNAAAVSLNNAETTTPETFDRAMAVNVRAPFFLSQAAMPHLKKTKGCIINISSIGAQRGVIQASAYSISKAALEHFTRVLALELAPIGVRVNAVTVGYTTTDTVEEFTKLSGLQFDSKKSRESYIDLAPLGGGCSMDDVSKVVTFLLSDLSAAMTGTCLPVDRGALVVAPVLESFAKSPMINMGDLNAMPTQTAMAALPLAAQAKK